MKYTAVEILEAAGVKSPKAKIGTRRVRIGGVPVNDPEHLINCQDAKSIEVIVGIETFVADLPDRPNGPSDKVKSALKAKGDRSKELFEKLRAEKQNA